MANGEKRGKRKREKERRVARRQLPAETAIGIALERRKEREAAREGRTRTERQKRRVIDRTRRTNERMTEKARLGILMKQRGGTTTEGKSVTTLGAQREGEKDDNRKSMNAPATGSTRRCCYYSSSSSSERKREREREREREKEQAATRRHEERGLAPYQLAQICTLPDASRL